MAETPTVTVRVRQEHIVIIRGLALALKEDSGIATVLHEVFGAYIERAAATDKTARTAVPAALGAAAAPSPEVTRHLVALQAAARVLARRLEYLELGLYDAVSQDWWYPDEDENGRFWVMAEREPDHNNYIAGFASPAAAVAYISEFHDIPNDDVWVYDRKIKSFLGTVAELIKNGMVREAD